MDGEGSRAIEENQEHQWGQMDKEKITELEEDQDEEGKKEQQEKDREAQEEGQGALEHQDENKTKRTCMA